MKFNDYKILVLLSGGVDSMVLSHFYKAEGYQVSCLFIDYNQKSVFFEEKASEGIASFLELPYSKIQVVVGHEFDKGEIEGRNMLLISTALTTSQNNPNVISIGVIKGSVYPDCSKTFIDKINDLVIFQTDSRTIVQAPLIEMSKQSVYDYALRNRLPLELSYSCENGIKEGCNSCLSCEDKFKYDYSQ